jgi:hypothetical protein
VSTEGFDCVTGAGLAAACWAAGADVEGAGLATAVGVADFGCAAEAGLAAAG